MLDIAVWLCVAWLGVAIVITAAWSLRAMWVVVLALKIGAVIGGVWLATTYLQ